MEEVEIRVAIIKETDLAILVAESLKNDTEIGVTGVWLPKSQISYMRRDPKDKRKTRPSLEDNHSSKAYIKIPEWLAEEKGFKY